MRRTLASRAISPAAVVWKTYLGSFRPYSDIPRGNLRQPGSSPCVSIVGAAAGAVRNMISAVAASASFAAVGTPPEYMVMFWIPAGRGPDI